MTRTRLPLPTEHQEQSLLMQWAATQYVAHPGLRWLVAVPNGGWRHQATAGRLRAEGVKPGYPDLILDVARGPYHGLRIELKRRLGWRVSREQVVWLEHLAAEGYLVAVCAGWEAARDELLAYLALDGRND